MVNPRSFDTQNNNLWMPDIVRKQCDVQNQHERPNHLFFSFFIGYSWVKFKPSLCETSIFKPKILKLVHHFIRLETHIQHFCSLLHFLITDRTFRHTQSMVWIFKHTYLARTFCSIIKLSVYYISFLDESIEYTKRK